MAEFDGSCKDIASLSHGSGLAPSWEEEYLELGRRTASHETWSGMLVSPVSASSSSLNPALFWLKRVTATNIQPVRTSLKSRVTEPRSVTRSDCCWSRAPVGWQTRQRVQSQFARDGKTAVDPYEQTGIKVRILPNRR